MVEHKWQPVMLISDRRLECECGAMAILIVLESEEQRDDEKRDCTYTGWCQNCFKTAQEAEEAIDTLC